MLTPERYRRLSALFHEACATPEAQREAFVEVACGDDADMRTELRRMLEHADTPLMLETALTGLGTRVVSAADGARFLAGYRIVGTLGEGGMGVVHRAEQDQPRREVALKVLRPGLLDEERLRRLQQESEILSRLSHPGIAAIHEAGIAPMRRGPSRTDPPIDDDALPLPFFAMELVRGAPIDAYANARNLDVASRLTLMALVCDAIDHAHRRGVIHRDLKPANILVTSEEDGSPRPKVLDFGVARLTDPTGQMETMRTTAGDVIGTLAYMSPEQVAGKGGDADPRTDVYALGVVLYELLSGRLPYEVRGRSLAEAARTIVEAPPAPLRAPGDVRLDRDIETIVLKALEKEPPRRYQTAADLAGDLRRSLRHEPILARPASTLYLARRFAQRNRGLVTGLATAITILLAALAVTLVQWQRIEKEARLAHEINAFLETLLIAADPYPLHRGMGVPLHFGVDVRFIEVLDDAVARLEAQPLTSPEAEATIQYRLGLSCYGFGRYRQGATMLTRAIELRRALHGPDDLRTLECQVGLVWHRTMLLDSFSAEQLAEETVAAHVRTVGWDRMETLRALGALAICRLYLGYFDDAVESAERMREISERTPELGFTRMLPRLLIADLFVRELDRIDEGEAMAWAILDEAAAGPEARTNVPGYARLILGRAARARGDLAEAERLLDEGIAIWSSVARTQALSEFRGELASVIAQQPGRAAEGLQRWRAVIEGHRADYGDDSPVAFLLERQYADALVRAGDLPGAEVVLQRCVTDWLDSGRYAILHRHVELLHALGSVQRQVGKPDAAQRTLERGLEIAVGMDDEVWRRYGFGPGWLHLELCRVLDVLGDTVAAERHLGLALRESARRADRRLALQLLEALDGRRWEDSITILCGAQIDLAMAQHGANDPRTARLVADLADALASRGLSALSAELPKHPGHRPGDSPRADPAAVSSPDRSR